MIYILSIIFALICLWLFGPWGFLLSPLILLILLSLSASDIVVFILFGILYVIIFISRDWINSFFHKFTKTFSIIGSYLGVYLGILCTLTYAEEHWWMFFTYLLFIISQLFFTSISVVAISESNSPIMKGIASVNIFICALISLLPFYLRFKNLYIDSPTIGFIHYEQYEGGILVYILSIITFIFLLFCLWEVIKDNINFRSRNYIRSTILGIFISLIFHVSIMYLLLKDTHISTALPNINYML